MEQPGQVSEKRQQTKAARREPWTDRSEKQCIDVVETDVTKKRGNQPKPGEVR